MRLAEHSRASARRDVFLNESGFRAVLQLYAEQPFWDDPRLGLRWSESFLPLERLGLDCVCHPAGIFIDNDKYFLFAVYLSLLGCMPDRDSFNQHLYNLAKGTWRATIVTSVLNSREYRAKGRALLYGDAGSLIQAEARRTRNLKILDQLCPDHLRDALENFRLGNTFHVTKYGVWYEYRR